MRSVFRVGFQREPQTGASAPLEAAAMKSATSRRKIIVEVIVVPSGLRHGAAPGRGTIGSGNRLWRLRIRFGGLQ